MVTGELKNKIDGLWDIFWAGGLSNPLDVIEQMTYLMFIHDLVQDILDRYIPEFQKIKNELEEQYGDMLEQQEL